jgi:hypothetical protein
VVQYQRTIDAGGLPARRVDLPTSDWLVAAGRRGTVLLRPACLSMRGPAGHPRPLHWRVRSRGRPDDPIRPVSGRINRSGRSWRHTAE